MRKIIVFLIFFIIFVNVLIAQDIKFESKESNFNFSLGAGFVWTNNPKLLGGYFDFGFVLYRNVLYVQNSIIMRGGGISIDENDHSIYTLSERLIFGRNTGDLLRIYTYIEGGFGIYGNQNKKFFEDPFAYTFGFGGGGEFSDEEFGGLFIEIGYIGQMIKLNYPVSGIILQTGWKIYF
jgi:hypothetical protein